MHGDTFARPEIGASRLPTVHEEAPTASPAEYLPAPPNDAEKHWYMGRQHRWLLIAQAASFCLIATSIWRFATADLRFLIFVVPTSLYAIALLVSLASSARRKRTSLADHLERVTSYQPDSWPSIDVFIPTAGEPLPVLENTFKHVARMEWAGNLFLLVLDDSARPEVRALAEQYGLRYETRPDRGRLKKAGNLSYGYRRTSGDFIAVFDADFVPRTDYLINLMPYTQDEKAGIIQSPQFFDARKGEFHWLQRSAGATQELFYRWVQPGRDASKAAICVGTCAIYRRAALELSGGFAQIGHSEDVHTGVNLMKVGFHVRYVPIILAKGICPDTLSGFLNQQYRWCTGSMSLLASPEFHKAEHIGFRQQLAFWAGFLYYISTALNAFVAAGPALIMLYMLPQWIEPMNSIWLVGALVLWFFVLPLMYRSHWRIDVLRVQLLYSYAHAVAIFHILFGRTKEWVATGSANTQKTPLGTQITRVAKTGIVLTQASLWTGLVLGTLHYGFDYFWAMLCFNALAAYVQLPILWLQDQPQKHRVIELPSQHVLVPQPRKMKA
ncbi:glycosyltransferase family 2 protein [Kineococcus sp. SYSU DK018]|uniref:glycosyltransferase family 2 protein n=1 Tax=Kineococcus sp. SYSU DK018 TaxID=3383139 RepID=UPI003D7D712A